MVLWFRMITESHLGNTYYRGKAILVKLSTALSKKEGKINMPITVRGHIDHLIQKLKNELEKQASDTNGVNNILYDLDLYLSKMDGDIRVLEISHINLTERYNKLVQAIDTLSTAKLTDRQESLLKRQA